MKILEERIDRKESVRNLLEEQIELIVGCWKIKQKNIREEQKNSLNEFLRKYKYLGNNN